MTYLYVAVGGMFGALARFALGGWVTGWAGASFPWATLLINLLGSVLLGLLMRAFPVWSTPVEMRALLAVGFCGAFTTFSTFGYETVLLLERGAPGLAATYALGSVVLGVAGIFLGFQLAVALT
jgi:CrcB protein